jgi:hypothetical protein
MKSFAVLASATALACSLAAADARADEPETRLSGEYAFTESQNCLYAPGFNSNLQPTNPAHSALGSGALAGTYTFDGRGGVTVDETFLGISTPASALNTSTVLPYATSQNGSGSGEYKFEADGSVTITFGLTAAKILTGPVAGVTFSIDQFVLSGRLSLDNKTLLLSTTEPVVSTALFSNGGVIHFICNFSGTAVKVGPETGAGD